MSILFTFISESPSRGAGGEGIYDTELKQEKGKLEPKITFKEKHISMQECLHQGVHIYNDLLGSLCFDDLLYIYT